LPTTSSLTPPTVSLAALTILVPMSLLGISSA
jgi:hypothetical protein